jgi:hypothetical protein
MAAVVTTGIVAKQPLFLDTDAPGMSQAFENDFVDEYPTYLPGAIQGGVSELVATVSGTGQYVRILAGFVNAFGVFMPAPPGATLEFGLASTSAWTGYAMNAGTSTDPDFALEGQNPAGFSEYYPYLAQIVLRARDCGGRTTATATLSTTNATAELRVPRPRDSSNVDSLPYAGWNASGVLVSTENQFVPHLDDEPDKNGGGMGASQGDGFSWYDEFRGAIVQGVHQRLNPQRKDLFVRSELTEGLGFATDLSGGGRPLTVWLIDANEMAANRNLNFNVSATSTIQKALHVLDGVYHLSGFIGATFTATPREFPGPRGVVAPIEIYLERIREVSPTANDRTTPDLIDSTAISKVIAHEIGHGVTIDHIVIPPPPQCDQSQPNPVPLTVMTSQVFVQTTSATHPCWLPANIPTGFQSGDIDQLQLR